MIDDLAINLEEMLGLKELRAVLTRLEGTEQVVAIRVNGGTIAGTVVDTHDSVVVFMTKHGDGRIHWIPLIKIDYVAEQEGVAS